MLDDPFAELMSNQCLHSVGPLQALTRGLPEGACVELTWTPITGVILLIVIGALITCLQVVVKKILFGRRDGYLTQSEDISGLSLREIANRARASEQP